MLIPIITRRVVNRSCANGAGVVIVSDVDAAGGVNVFKQSSFDENPRSSHASHPIENVVVRIVVQVGRSY